jgi:ATP-dependent helicase/nuclease subunit B
VPFFTDENQGNDPVMELVNLGRVFLDEAAVRDLFKERKNGDKLLHEIFGDWSSAPAGISRLQQIVKILASSSVTSSVNDSNLDQEYLYQFSLMLNRLEILVGRAGAALSLKGLFQLLRTVADSTQLPFVGEPLKGLQVMGMLETRTLDFENVIMLSVNEGILPAGKNMHSFIPLDIRNEFGLPVYSDRDAVFAYHFYRLLQRCSNMYLIYNTTPDALGGGEKSRFILQLEHELSKLNPQITIEHKVYTPAAELNRTASSISIPKTPDIEARLANMAAYGISPTALTTWVFCPLRFYFNYILQLAEEESIADTMDAPTFGTGIHNALESLYKPFLNQALSLSIIDAIATKADDVLYENFRQAFNNNDLSQGKNLIMLRVAESFLRRFFAQEKDLIRQLERNSKQLIVKAVEHKFSENHNITTTVSFKGQPDYTVCLRGTADRIDLCGETLRVIDFKTGLVEQKELVIKDWEALLIDPAKGKALQLALYAWLYSKEFSTAFPQAGIISFRNLNSGFLALQLPEADTDPSAEFEETLQQLLQQIFDTETPFTQTEDAKSCEICPFAGICGK